MDFKKIAIICLFVLLAGAAISWRTRKQNITDVRIQLKPGEAIILNVTTVNNANASKWQYLEMAHPPLVLNSGWSLSFKEGGPSIPSAKAMEQLKPWTSFTDDSATQNFSGTGVYSTTFTLPQKNASEYLLQLGKVYESARVYINGKDAGIVWSIPFEARIGQYLKAGQNTITIEVANLMANRIRYMDRMGMEWRKYHEINFVNIDYKNFDASKWKVETSGMEGPVTITPFGADTR